jgi:hypothetical protein
MLFGVYLLIRKRAVLRYIWHLLAFYVSLLANMCVLYQIYCPKSSDNARIIKEGTGLTICQLMLVLRPPEAAMGIINRPITEQGG